MSRRLLRNDASPREGDRRAREQDAGSANSSAICATEDELSRRPVRSRGRGFVFQQPLRVWAIVSKDMLEIFRARGTYFYIPGMLLMSAFFFFSYYGLTNTLAQQNASQRLVVEASRAFLNSLGYLLPVLYALFACNLTSAGLVFEKQKRSLESLLATPLSVRRIWIGKSLGASLSGTAIGLGMSIFAYCVIAFGEVYPRIHSAIAPSGLAFLSGLVLVPITVFLVSLLVSYIQLVAANPRMGNLVYGLLLLVVWGILFFASYYLPLLGVSVNYYPLIFVGLILLLSGGAYLCSRALAKEKVVLSSKG
jgi:ABC-2 type transport system permease protein